MKNSVLYTSKSAEWYTPPHIVGLVVDALGAIDLDPCSNSGGVPVVPAATHYTEDEDGLACDWHGRVYMNPPYGRTIGLWVSKLELEYTSGRVSEAIALVPARVDTKWFRVFRDYTVCFVSGRLRFSGADTAPFPSALFYLGADDTRFCEAFNSVGDLYRRVVEEGK